MNQQKQLSGKICCYGLAGSWTFDSRCWWICSVVQKHLLWATLAPTPIIYKYTFKQREDPPKMTNCPSHCFSCALKLAWYATELIPTFVCSSLCFQLSNRFDGRIMQMRSLLNLENSITQNKIDFSQQNVKGIRGTPAWSWKRVARALLRYERSRG